jgi:hypothetical protein
MPRVSREKSPTGILLHPPTVSLSAKVERPHTMRTSCTVWGLSGTVNLSYIHTCDRSKCALICTSIPEHH